MSLDQETRRIVQLAEAILRPPRRMPSGVGAVADPWRHLDELLKKLLAGAASDARTAEEAAESPIEWPVPPAAPRAAAHLDAPPSPKFVAQSPEHAQVRAARARSRLSVVPNPPAAGEQPLQSPARAARPTPPESPLRFTSTPQGLAALLQAHVAPVEEPGSPAVGPARAEGPTPPAAPVRFTSTAQELAALRQAHGAPVVGPARAEEPAESPLRFTSTPQRLATLLQAHVVPGEDPAPTDLHASHAGPLRLGSGQASTPLRSAQGERRAFSVEDLLAGGTTPAASDLLLDALLDRLEVRLRDQSIRHFGLTGGDL